MAKKKFSTTVQTGEYSPQQFLMLVNVAFSRLGWPQPVFDENKITVQTGMSAASFGEEVSATVNGAEAELLSQCDQGIDWGKNKKNITQLAAEIEKLRNEFTPAQLDEQYNSLMAEAEQEAAAFVERYKQGNLTAVDKLAINQEGHYVTYTLIALNVLVFIAMVIGGVSFINPSVPDILFWGGNARSYTASGDWWRLITNVFVHIGVIHLLLNMYALFSVGMYLEPIMGRWKFLAAYLSSGVMASLVSIWWADNRVSAGASGAIFGMYGLFLALLTTNYIDKRVRAALMPSILIFVGYNLIYGLKGGIDNAAHIGGLVSGFVLGYIFYYLHVKQPRPQLFTPAAVGVAVLMALPVLNSKRDDTARFGMVWDEFAQLESKGLAPLQNSSKLDSGEFVRQAETISMPTWMEMKTLMDKTKKYHLPAVLDTERMLMNRYVDQRILHTRLWIQIVKENNGNLWPKLDSITGEIDKTISQIQK